MKEKILYSIPFIANRSGAWLIIFILIIFSTSLIYTLFKGYYLISIIPFCLITFILICLMYKKEIIISDTGNLCIRKKFNTIMIKEKCIKSKDTQVIVKKKTIAYEAIGVEEFDLILKDATQQILINTFGDYNQAEKIKSTIIEGIRTGALKK